jgi:FKBP-type peptidyl-prolyl cis-trans isomerase FklB
MKTAKRAALALALASAASFADESTKLDSNVQKFSYAIGLQLGDNLKNQGILSLDEKALALGIRDYLDGNDLKLDPEDIQQAVAAYQQEMMEERLALAEENRDAAESFLEKNGQRDGVVVLESGVQYEVLEKGSGENPTETDIVVVHYRGYLLDGSEFDSSFSRGQPTELEIAQVIPGWQQTLQLMKVGSKWKVWIPSDLAYGLRGAGNKIGPNEMLHFNIELLSIKEEG